MRIIIQGDNRVATDLAINLAAEGVDIALVSTDQNMLDELAEKHEIRCIKGVCSDPGTLGSLDVKTDDTFITVSDNDELNLVSCQIASAHSVMRSMCRLRNYRLGHWVEEHPQYFGITDIFRPELLIEEQLLKLIRHPGAFQQEELHDGLVQVLGVKARKDGPLVGRQLSEIRNLMPDLDTRVVAIYTSDGPVSATGGTVVCEGDDVFFIVHEGREDDVIRVVHGREPHNKRIFIAGGGNIGMQLAKELQHDFQVKLLESNLERCNFLADQLENVIVLHGKADDRDLLTSEYISDVDVFCATTNNDQINYLSSMLAKKLGAHHVISLINEAAYVDLVEGRDIDTVLVPSQISIGRLLGMVRRDVTEAKRLRRGAAEVVSVRANGKAVGKLLGDLKMPAGASIGAVVREGKMLVAHRKIIIHSEDAIILFLTDMNCLHELTRQIA